MPLYEYVCYDCDTTFETLRPMQKADAPIQCQTCESMNTERALSQIAVLSNGDSAMNMDIPLKSSGMAGGCCGGACGCG